MNLVPFNETIYKRLLGLGYAHILVKQPTSKLNRWQDENYDVQILKAVHNCDYVPDDFTREPIDSELVKTLLHETSVSCFVIFSDEKTTMPMDAHNY